MLLLLRHPTPSAPCSQVHWATIALMSTGAQNNNPVSAPNHRHTQSHPFHSQLPQTAPRKFFPSLPNIQIQLSRLPFPHLSPLEAAHAADLLSASAGPGCFPICPCMCACVDGCMDAHTRTHARTQARTHTRTHACTCMHDITHGISRTGPE